MGISQYSEHAHPAERKRLIFNASLPRSGGTLLQVILAQNPAVFPTVHSPLVDLIHGTSSLYDGTFSGEKEPNSLSVRTYRSTIRGILGNFYSFADCPVVVDKGGTGALQYSNLFAKLIRSYQVIICVRDLRGVIASLESDFAAGLLDPSELPPQSAGQSRTERINWWLKSGPLATAIARIRGAASKPSDRYHLIRYEDLCAIPKATLGLLYDFLGLPHYSHDFSDLRPLTTEHCFMKPGRPHGTAVHPPRLDWNETLGTETCEAILRAQVLYYRDFYPEAFSMNPHIILSRVDP